MGIEDTLISRRTVLQAGLAGVLYQTLPLSIFAQEQDFYAAAYKAWKRGDLEQTEVILHKGTQSSKKKQQAECYHFLGYIRVQEGKREDAKSLYTRAFEIADMNKRFVDEAFDEALRADFIASGARVSDEKAGTVAQKIHSKAGKSGEFQAEAWNKYYFKSGELSQRIQKLFRNSELASQRSIHDFMLRYIAKVERVGFFPEGYFVAMIKDNKIPSGYYGILWRTEITLKEDFRKL